MGRPQKLKTELPYDPAILRVFFEENENTNTGDQCPPLCCILFTTAETRKQPGSVDGRTVQKTWSVCVCVCVCTRVHDGILFSHKKGSKFAICDNMDGPREVLC